MHRPFMSSRLAGPIALLYLSDIIEEALMLKSLSRQELEQFSNADLVRYAELLQKQLEQHRPDNGAVCADALIEQDYRHRIGAANAALRESELESSRERSFYWRIMANIGRALKVDLPALAGKSNDEDWRAYAQAVESHVCGDKPRTLLTSA